MRLKEKVALITGASQGLAIARRSTLEDARVFIGDIKEEQDRGAVGELVGGVTAW
jgi:NAD(P)-dependent dehydrogenase (short-subunit alcohol dehydrogenase family)